MSMYKSAPAALMPLTESEIIADWIGGDVVVSVLCATFNHEKYIDDAIRGFLAQKTNFPFEIIIRDDASNDKTADIIRSYVDKYPKIIKPIYESINKYPLIKPGVVTRGVARGKYYAYCEGDDYWIDSCKLQKQVDYFLKNPDITLLETRAIAIENDQVIDWPGLSGTRTMMHASKIKIPSKYYTYIYFGDTYLKNVMAMHGKSAMLNDVTAVWRKHDGGIFGSMQTAEKQTELNFQRASTNFWIAMYNLEQGHEKAAFKSLRHTINLLLVSYPKTNYVMRLKLASYFIMNPLIPTLSKSKKLLRSFF